MNRLIRPLLEKQFSMIHVALVVFIVSVGPHGWSAGVGLLGLALILFLIEKANSCCGEVSL